MKIIVSVKNRTTQEAIAGAKVALRLDGEVLEFEGSEEPIVFTGDNGKTRAVDTPRSGRILSWTVDAKGFELEQSELEVDRPEQNITVFLDPVEEKPRVQFTISTADERGNPLNGVVVIAEREGSELERIRTTPSGKAVFSLSPELAGKKIKYSARHDGYLPAQGECVLQTGALQEALLKKIPRRGWVKWLIAATVLGVAAVAIYIAVGLSPNVEIVDFIVNKDSLTIGGSATLKWAVKGADKVYLNKESVGLEGRKRITPQKTTNYTLVAKKGSTTISRTIRVGVERFRLPRPRLSTPPGG